MGGTTRFLVLLTTPLPPRTASLLRLSHHHRYRHCLFPLSSLPTPRKSNGSSYPLGYFRINSLPSQLFHSQAVTFRDDHFSNSVPSTTPPGAQHQWPEWVDFLRNLHAGGYFRRESSAEDEYAAGFSLQEDFLSAARACFAFARDRPHLLTALRRNDVEIIVNNGTPFLFKSGDDSIRRMRLFLNGDEVEDSGKPRTIDLMRFILSYASNPLANDAANFSSQEPVVSSVRNLISEFVKLSSIDFDIKFGNPSQNQFSDTNDQSSRPRRQNFEMKRGDWICPRCNFMNFARNLKCLECEESRPKRQLLGGEWECPQCNFLNNGRNMACLRCDCKHPGGFPSVGSGFNSGKSVDRTDLERRLAANEVKAQSWFSKVSQLGSTSELNSAITDEDFPEIIPLRKGVNRFVVSTRKTPLERRLANSKCSSTGGSLPSGDSQTSSVHKNADSLLSRRLDDIMGRKSDDMDAVVSNDLPRDCTPSYSITSAQRHSPGNSTSYVPFVPLPADMFAKKPKNLAIENRKAVERKILLSSNSEGQISAEVGGPNKFSEDKDSKHGEKSERWFERIAELHDSQDVTSTNADEDFPEIMPLRKGENQFVVSKKKDRSLTSPMYKRRAVMEQANSNYVPFVPFPPDYFAKKETQQSNARISIHKAASEIPSSSTKRKEQKKEDLNPSSGTGEGKLFVKDAINTHSIGVSQTSSNTGNMNEGTNETSSSTQQPRCYSWSGKSLEGSAVKEPDRLDMSEEAKAERWFRRVAQIKDISELSQIPDEDFPSIMPMRKGVNRFVVSKRKTPLERRLTSSQYRRNLPVVSSDPGKKDTKGD
ncbi:hypothetical protein SAY87_020329 [Trapa incisa]|uniref:RanBP2-type domain-containing protein n=1 Tax=Trapa incisa TaxID=236973 RepID=A0AAN7K0K6_9MYRT|nr:hypothetical protein SAY87_020329 [Trapa incisa]